MTGREVKRWLKDQGCSFENKTKHEKVILGDRWTLLPRHWSQEIKPGTLKAILRDLGLEMKKK